MKKLCGLDKRELMKWIDGALDSGKAAVVSGHLEGCASCREEEEAIRRLNGLLRISQENIEVSRDFETVFWSKVSQRQSLPWLERLLNSLEALVPTPNFRQAVAFSILAFFIGNIGGFGWELGQGAFAAPLPASIRQFSGLQEFKGISSTSLAATYLTAVQTEGSK